MTKILVVDDEANVQRLLQYTLKQAGYTVAVAGDGVEALKLWATEQPGLILLDVSLPKLDGYGVAERIRADEGGKKQGHANQDVARRREWRHDATIRRRAWRIWTRSR